MKNSPHEIVAFLPCRKGSERVLRKNTRPFANVKNGLIEIKLRQLIGAKKIDKIVVSTDDLDIWQLCDEPQFKAEARLEILRRPAELAKPTTSTDNLIEHASHLIPEGDILWTHVTSPFIDTKAYDEIISAYHNGLDQGYDSLMTVTPLRSFIWSSKGAVNYDPAIEKWPRTQTLDPMFIVNSGVFIASSNIYKTERNRIGQNPVLHPLSKIQELDIDWMDDFELCEHIWAMQHS